MGIVIKIKKTILLVAGIISLGQLCLSAQQPSSLIARETFRIYMREAEIDLSYNNYERAQNKLREALRSSKHGRLHVNRYRANDRGVLLSTAAKNGYYRIVRLLLGEDEVDPNVIDKANHSTPLMEALSFHSLFDINIERQIKVVEALVNHRNIKIKRIS